MFSFCLPITVPSVFFMTTTFYGSCDPPESCLLLVFVLISQRSAFIVKSYFCLSCAVHPPIVPVCIRLTRDESCCERFNESHLYSSERGNHRTLSHFKPHKHTATTPLHFAQAPLNHHSFAEYTQSCVAHVTLSTHLNSLSVCLCTNMKSLFRC